VRYNCVQVESPPTCPYMYLYARRIWRARCLGFCLLCTCPSFLPDPGIVQGFANSMRCSPQDWIAFPKSVYSHVCGNKSSTGLSSLCRLPFNCYIAISNVRLLRDQCSACSWARHPPSQRASGYTLQATVNTCRLDLFPFHCKQNGLSILLGFQFTYTSFPHCP
jgi:hypothetical protein